MRYAYLLPVAIAAVAVASPAAAVEVLNVPFTGPAVGTTDLYTGTVTITVSGTGQSGGSQFNDAFYLLDGPSSPGNGLYQLGLGTTSFPTNDSSRYAAGQIDGGRPAFSASNTYTFQFDVGATPTQIYFANLDDVLGDNSGAYQITVGVVPEPASWAMMIGGFGVVGGAARTRRRSRAAIA